MVLFPHPSHPNQCMKYEKGEKPAKSNVVIVTGLNKNIINLVIKCSETEVEQHINLKVKIIEKHKSENSAELSRIFATMAKKYTGKTIDKTTQPEREKAAEDFLELIKNVSNIITAELWGGMKTGNVHEYSDVDIKLIRSKCPGPEKCRVNKILNKKEFHIVDVCCFPK